MNFIIAALEMLFKNPTLKKIREISLRGFFLDYWRLTEQGNFREEVIRVGSSWSAT